MFARFFRHDGTQFNFLFATQNIISYDYVKNWTKGGDFTLTLSYDKLYMQKLSLNTFIEYGDDWLFIENIRYDMRSITLSGHDCKQLLYLRISHFGTSTVAGTEGYDAISGTTSYCIRHFLDDNLISPADSIRELPVTFQDNGVIGLADDGYMARLENIGDIVEKLCNSAGIGYEVMGRLSHNDFVFFLKNTTDKSKNQSANPKVIFSAERQNVLSAEFEHDETNFYNAIIATGADTLQIVYRDTAVPQGLARRECTTDVTVDSSSQIRQYALYAVEDNLKTENYTIAVSVNDYGTKFSLGDIVSVKDDTAGNWFTNVITAVHFSQNTGSQTVEITLGHQKPKLLNKIVNNMLNGTIRKG